MDNIFATRTGTWSDTSIWNTSALPAFDDNVYANGFNITADIDAQVSSLRTTASAGTINSGGSFLLSNNVTLSAEVYSGSSICLQFTLPAPNFCTVVGQISGSSTTPGIVGIRNSNSGTINIYGDVYGGSHSAGSNFAGAHGASNTSTGTINIIGNVFGSRAPTVIYNHGIINTSSGSVSITGNTIGGVNTTNFGCLNTSVGRIIINGNTIGGWGNSADGCVNESFGFIIVNGDAVAGNGSGAFGADNAGSGILIINGISTGNSFGSGAPANIFSSAGVFGSPTGLTIIQGLSCGSRGAWPVRGNVFFNPTNTSVAVLETSAFQPNEKTLSTILSTPDTMPPPSAVRAGTVYSLPPLVGVCQVPSISSVLLDIPVDNSFGRACHFPSQVWNYQTSAADVNTIGDRLKYAMNIKTFGQFLTSFGG